MEFKRTQDGRETEITEPVQLIFDTYDQVIWQRSGGVGYRGSLKEKNILDFGHQQFIFTHDTEQQMVILENDRTRHWLKREKKYDNYNLDHLNLDLPHISDSSLNERFIKATDWKVMRILGSDGRIYNGPVKELINHIRTADDKILFYGLEKNAVPIYQLTGSSKNVMYLEDENGIQHIFLAYPGSAEDQWILSDFERTIFYYIQKQYR